MANRLNLKADLGEQRDQKLLIVQIRVYDQNPVTELAWGEPDYSAKIDRPLAFSGIRALNGQRQCKRAALAELAFHREFAAQ